MKVIIDKTNQELELDFQGAIAQLLEKLELNSQTVIIVKNGEIVTKDHQVDNNDTVSFLSILSGG